MERNENGTDPGLTSKPIISIFCRKNQLKIRSSLEPGDWVESCCKYPDKMCYGGLDPGYSQVWSKISSVYVTRTESQTPFPACGIRICSITRSPGVHIKIREALAKTQWGEEEDIDMRELLRWN